MHICCPDLLLDEVQLLQSVICGRFVPKPNYSSLSLCSPSSIRGRIKENATAEHLVDLQDHPVERNRDSSGIPVKWQSQTGPLQTRTGGLEYGRTMHRVRSRSLAVSEKKVKSSSRVNKRRSFQCTEVWLLSRDSYSKVNPSVKLA